MTEQLETRGLRLTCIKNSEGEITGLALAVRDGDVWHHMGMVAPLGYLIYQDSAGNRREATLSATNCHVTDEALELQREFVDVDGETWHLSAMFTAVDDPYQIVVDYRLDVEKERKILHCVGPSFKAGEGSFGSAKDEALFPGLEYLLDDEPSSDTRFAAPKYANRTVPHPYKVSIPLMAVSHAGRAIGLMWNPNQDWGTAWRHPAAIFSSPNRLQEGAGNHYMALALPPVEPRWRNEGELEAHTPLGIAPGKPGMLSARLIALPEGGVLDVLRAWVATYGLPSLPEPGHSYRENIDLCVRSYLEVAWDDEADGWHHTLADPWGPHYEPLVAEQLWRYSRWPEGDPILRARAADQVHRAVAGAGHPPHPALALIYGQVAGSLDKLAEEARKLMAEQDASGAWLWSPAVVANIADFKSEDRLKVMGAEKDSSSGFTASRAQTVVQYALYTGDPGAVDAVIRAADWCNGQRRPEGAQTWELHLHVPDVLATPHLITLNLAALELTGDEHYLDAANRWAWTGLPFTYLWNGYYRPIMRYGTIPVFGVTFHDVQSWFGVIVHWNGLVYAQALFQLARYCNGDGPMDWYALAEGITRHGMQEQMPDGPWMGMYPDAFSPVKGDEEYTWWLNPRLVGVNTFPLGGLPLTAEPLVLRTDGDTAVHVASGARVVEAGFDTKGVLHLLLDDQPGAFSFTLVASGKRPASVVCAGITLPHVENLDAAPQGWQWLPAHNLAVVKVQHVAGAVAVRCAFE